MTDDHGRITDAGRLELQLARDANTEARIGANRIGLLFGEKSDAVIAAGTSVQSRRWMINTLEGVPEAVAGLTSHDSRVERAQELFDQAEDTTVEFVEAVNRRLGYSTD
jgi:hypothetical protein